jgi:hypothetical protein
LSSITSIAKIIMRNAISSKIKKLDLWGKPINIKMVEYLCISGISFWK